MVADILPVPKPREYWTDRAAKLEEFRDRYPEEDAPFIWAYMAFTNEKLGIVRKSEVGIENAKIWSAIPVLDLIKQYEADRDLYSEFLSMCGLRKASDMDSPQAYDGWNIAMADKLTYNRNSSISARHHIKLGKYRQFDNEGWSYRTNKRELYAQHRQALARMEHMSGLDTKIVFDGIEQMKKGHAPGATNKMEIATTNAPLEIPVPSMSDEDIAAMIANIEPNSFDAITGFGRALQSDVAKALRDISEYFIQHSARPAQTLDRVEQIMKSTSLIDTHTLLPAMPTTAFNRAAGRIFGVRLVKPEDMPFAQIVEMASDLSERADHDDKFFSHDLKIIDHAIRLCAAYADIMERAATAFEADKDRLVPQTEDNSPMAQELGTSFLPELFEARVSGLKRSVHFLNNQAGRFGQMGRTIGHTREQLNQMESLSHTVQIPALDAIQAFNLYQLKRLSAFGRAVNQGVMDQLQINDQTAAEIAYADENTVLISLDRARTSLNDTFAALSTHLTSDMKGQRALALEINDETTKHLLGTPKEPSQG